MNLRFHIDPETALPHIYDHGVREYEVREALDRSVEDRLGEEGSRIAIGITASGRHLRVVYAPDADGESAFVITAYDLKGKPLKAFRRRRRRRHP